ncbi:MAG TPA: winged helix-turn-helix transcriptional regulator [Solirubrobacterales bacterium]|nr:winged helix-turn-helix transcriptional regulator [Solirubrobacterales bacterium]
MNRAGSTALSLLSGPLNVDILRTLEKEPLGPVDLRRTVGFPPQSTMRVYIRTLAELEVVERRRQNEFPGSVDYVLTDGGTALLEVGRVLQAWLREAPGGEIELGTTAAKTAVKALVEGWSTNIVRALSARALTLTDLNRLIPSVSYPSLERRLTAMRLRGLAERTPGDGRGSPYAASTWMRRAVVPLGAAMAWERRHAPGGTTPIGRLDVEAAFLLAVPLMDLGPQANGRCRLAVELQGGSSPVFAGVSLCIEEGRVVSCVSRLDGEAEAWVSGTPIAWFGRMDGSAAGELELGGDTTLAASVTDALRGTASAAA